MVILKFLYIPSQKQQGTKSGNWKSLAPTGWRESASGSRFGALLIDPPNRVPDIMRLESITALALPLDICLLPDPLPGAMLSSHDDSASDQTIPANLAKERSAL